MQSLFHHSESIQQIQVKYKLIPLPSDNRWQTILEIAKDLSASGYVYKQLLYTTSNGTFTDFLAFIRTRKSRLPYRYRLFVEPSTSDALLKQVSAQGARGFRFKTYLGNATAFFLVYVRDSSRPLAKYIYRHAPCVSNRDELFVQISKNAAEGYRVLDSFLLSNSCVLYIKDTSKRSRFIYKSVPNFSTIEDLLATTNELGAEGYRHAGDLFIDFVSNATASYSRVLLFYRDTKQKHCTFSYSSAPVPSSGVELIDVLQEKEKKSFIYLKTFNSATGRFLIFVKFHNCRYKRMNIDASY